MKSSFIALPLAAVFGFVSSEVHAMPNFGINLVKVSGEGVKPLPGIEALTKGGASAPDPVIAQAGSVALDESGNYQIISSGTRTISVKFQGSVPRFDGPLYIVGEDGSVYQTVYPNSVRFTNNRTQAVIDLSFQPTADNKYYVLFPETAALPDRLTPCAFIVRDAVAAAPVPKAKGPNVWPYVLGALAIGGIICAIACGGGGGGGGGGDDDEDGGEPSL